MEMYEYSRLTQQERAALVRERLQLGSPSHSPPHRMEEASCYLLTAACYRHQQIVNSDERRGQLLDLLFERFILAGVEIRAWVILPNHYHLIVRLAERVEIGGVLKLVHGPTARRWNQDDGTTGREVWYRYSDRAMRSERHYLTTLNYIHFNPVKHGWARSVYDWPASSVHWYLEHCGREWLRNTWRECPLREYGRDWDGGEA
jgi:putative transposase